MTSKNDPKRKNLMTTLLENFNVDQKFYTVSFFKSFIQKFKSPKRHKLFEKAQTKLQRELDLHKFIESKRLLMSAILGLLKPQ